MRDLILHGGEVLNSEVEENQRGKADLQVSDIFKLYGLNFRAYFSTDIPNKSADVFRALWWVVRFQKQTIFSYSLI